MSVIKDLMWFFKQEKKSYIIGILVLLLVAMLELVPPRIIGIGIDLIKDGVLTEKILARWVIVLLVTAAALYLLRYIWRILIFGSSLKLARLLRNELYEHFTKMSPSFYQQKRIGDLMAHATNDIQAVQQTAGFGILALVDSVILGSFVLATMALTISWKLTFFSLLPMPIMIYASKRYGTILHKRFLKAQEAFSSLNDKVQESISGIKVIKTFGYEEEDIKQFHRQSKQVVKDNMGVARIDALFDPTISIIVGISFFLAVVFGSQMVLRNEITLGDLVSFTTYLGILIWPMLAFGWLFNIVERGRASYDRIRNLLETKQFIEENANAIHCPPTGNITFKLESFCYPNETIPALKNIHFILGKGETLGIVGKTGAGKTTLLKLLVREFEQYEGKIMFGEHEISEYSLEALRSSIGYVPQDHFLFSASIRENIAFACPDANDKEIIKAAQIANIHQDIVHFVDGYDTVVGERGVSLSGGQKQRISIARALLMDPEILILDDALSAVDAKTEENILTALKENREDKTTIITSHRLSAIQHANLILVIDGGRIVQKGTHVELMNEAGWYREMYYRQQLESLVKHGG